MPTIDVEPVEFYLRDAAGTKFPCDHSPRDAFEDPETAGIIQRGERVQIHLFRLAVRVVGDGLPVSVDHSWLASIVQSR